MANEPHIKGIRIGELKNFRVPQVQGFQISGQFKNLLVPTVEGLNIEIKDTGWKIKSDCSFASDVKFD